MSVPDAREVRSIVLSRHGVWPYAKGVPSQNICVYLPEQPQHFRGSHPIALPLSSVDAAKLGEPVSELVREWSTTSVCYEYWWYANCIQVFGIMEGSRWQRIVCD